MDTSVDSTRLAAVMACAARGDRRAWVEIVDAYLPLVWRVARGHRLAASDADDVCQTTWLLLYEHLPRLREPTALPSWLITTARRESLRLLRSRSREAPRGLLDEETGPRHADDGPEARLLHADLAGRMWQAFRELPERCQRLLGAMAFAPEWSYAQVSRALGVPVGTIGPRRGRCLTQLRRRMRGCDFPEEAAG